MRANTLSRGSRDSASPLATCPQPRPDAPYYTGTVYREARRAVVQHAITRVQHATGEAVETLRAVMQDTTAPASAKVSAARAILETAVKAVELEDLEARMAALEVQTGVRT